MNNTDRQYIDLVDTILKGGTPHNDRTGVGTLRVWGYFMRFNLQQGFPLITVKKASWKNTYAELLWFLSASTNVNDLVSIHPPAEKWWRPWAKPDGSLGPMYGEQYKYFTGLDPETGDVVNIDQIATLIQAIRTDPNSRRLLLTTYSPVDAPYGALYPCHGLTTQFQVENGMLHCSTVQRSADVMLGVPANIASYAMLTHMIAHVCGLQAGQLCYLFNDAHIYTNHLEGAYEVVHRGEQDHTFPLSTLRINPEVKNIDEFEIEDVWVDDYYSSPAIRLPIAV